jgi:hypothetical protein
VQAMPLAGLMQTPAFFAETPYDRRALDPITEAPVVIQSQWLIWVNSRMRTFLDDDASHP